MEFVSCINIKITTGCIKTWLFVADFGIDGTEPVPTTGAFFGFSCNLKR
jgi:hypothetical protein